MLPWIIRAHSGDSYFISYHYLCWVLHNNLHMKSMNTIVKIRNTFVALPVSYSDSRDCELSPRTRNIGHHVRILCVQREHGGRTTRKNMKNKPHYQITANSFHLSRRTEHFPIPVHGEFIFSIPLQGKFEYSFPALLKF